MRIILINVILVLTFISCARQSTLSAELTPRLLNAVNLEETISRRDELMLAYSLTSFDAHNQAVAVVNGGWGVESIKRGQQLDLNLAGPQQAKPINLVLPRNGRLVASLVLIEVDDYNQARQTIAKIQKIHNIVAVPVGLGITAVEVLTPLKYVSAGLAASGVGLQLLDKIDNDDVLGQSSLELHEADIRQKKQRLVRVPATFSGRNMRDVFEYRLEYDVALKTVKIQPVRQ